MRDAPDQEFLTLQEALAGRYSLEREIGRGGMGIVYLAREVRLDRPVALKLLPPALAAQSALRERFLHEARTAARLSHPHIVPIHAVDEAGAFVFIVMAYVEGETLEQRIRTRGPLPATEAARILRELAWALAYAHAQGVVHRDIKPGNILLEVGNGRALVTDFGIAHVGDQLPVKGSAEVIGTAEYMSPEQASGGTVDGRSDLYALGAVGYYMLCGRVPLEGATTAQTLARQITQPAAPLASVAPEVPAALAHAIDRCLAKQPAARFADGEHLAEAIGLALQQRQEVPIALRMFNERVQESSRSLGVLLGLSLYFLAIATYAGLGTEALGSIVAGIAIVGLLFGGTPFTILLKMTRGLLRSGYGHDELLRAVRGEVEEMRAALGSHSTEAPGRWDRLISRLGLGSLAGYLASLGYMMSGIYIPGGEAVLLPLMAVTGVGFVGSGLYSGAKRVMEGRPRGERWLKFWDSKFGRGLFKIAEIGNPRPVLSGASYRPTELAIGMAADRLFDELPADLRASMSELPAVVRALEQHAEQARARCAELNEILHGIEHEGGLDHQGRLASSSSIGARRDRLYEDVRESRDAAEQRLAEVVGGLETIRLQLLRMHAGAGSLASLTADLSAARELSNHIEDMIEAGRQVDELLGLARDAHIGDTPVPA